MAFDIIPNRLWSFPPLSQFQVPSMWDDEGELTLPVSNPSGLSVSEDDRKVYIEASVPGVNPKDIEITYQDGYLWVRGDVKEVEKDKQRKYYREATSSFSYRVAVPGDINEQVEPIASYKNGVMTVEFVKSPQSQPKKIQVKVNKDEESK